MSAKKVNNICKVHKCEMIAKEVSIMYGLPVGPVIGYCEAKESLFPNCDDILLGGCEIWDGQKSKSNIYVCEQCNNEREKWKKLHRSEIIFETSIDIKKDIVLVFNDNEIIEIDNTNVRENFYINCLSLSNGKHIIFIRNKDTGENITSIEIELKNESTNIIIFIDDKNNILTKVKYRGKINALWY